MNFQDLRRHATEDPARLALSTQERSLTYGELESHANRLAHVLRALGLQRGDHAVSLMGNEPDVLALAWACWRSGVYLTPMSTYLTASELAYLVTDSDARAVFTSARQQTLAQALQASLTVGTCRWLVTDGEFPGFESLVPLLASASDQPCSDETPGALMMYTSGTTGAPKGVIRPLLPPDWHGTPPFAADLHTLFGLAGADVRYLSTAPLYHAAALRCALAVTAGGGWVYVMDRFDASTALDLLASERITHSQWVPTMFQRLLALPLERRQALHAPAHTTALHGAAPCPPAVKQAMIDWWGPILLEYYSGSEGIGLTLIDSPDALKHPGSVGRARKGTIHIVGSNDEALPAGQTGVVYFSGVAPFQYHKAPDKTAQRTHPQGWQTFGDIGHVDTEGYLYLTDRADDMIISGGVNLYPQEIEQVLRQLPEVWDCAVVGFPDPEFGERPVAFVVADRASGLALDALRQRLTEHCAQQLGRLKRPDRFEFTNELPYSPSGKVLRRQLRASGSLHTAPQSRR